MQLCRRHLMCFHLCQHRLFHDDDPWFCINRLLWNSCISRIQRGSGVYSLWRSEERKTSRLAEEVTQRPCIKLFIFKEHDCLVFQAAFHSKRRIKIQYPHLGLVMHGIICFCVVVDAHCFMSGRVQLHPGTLTVRCQAGYSCIRKAVYVSNVIFSILIWKIVAIDCLNPIFASLRPVRFSCKRREILREGNSCW
jgi:hypothetical protein